MDTRTQVASKMLVLDDAGTYVNSLKAFCEECALLGIRPNVAGNGDVMAVLRANVDLGGILLYENYGGRPGNGLVMAREIHALRPELPIFLRRDAVSSVAGLGERDAAMFRCHEPPCIDSKNPEPDCRRRHRWCRIGLERIG